MQIGYFFGEILTSLQNARLLSSLLNKSINQVQCCVMIIDYISLQNEKLVFDAKISICLHQQRGRTVNRIHRTLIEGF